MATKYAWLPVMRFIPQDGPEELLVLYEAFSDTSGPGKVVPSHAPEMVESMDSQRRATLRPFGFRPMCKMTFELVDMAQQAYLQAMLVRLMATGSWACHLSLDDAATFRQVVLDSYSGPEPLRGKTFAGAKYEVGVRGVDLLEEPPVLGLGVW
jgi:hypothetical protein